jgi:cytochrome b561
MTSSLPTEHSHAAVRRLLAKPVIVVVSLHAAAALWQHFFVKSDLLVGMLRPAGRRER